MAKRCGCSDACSCLIVPGPGITLEGIGTVERPYEIGSDAFDLAGRLTFEDTDTVDFTTSGVGTVASPFLITAESAIAMTDLTDIGVGQVPSVGEVPVWHTDHWEFELPSLPGGAGVPVGGTLGQVLAKLSATDLDTTWQGPLPYRMATGAVSVALSTQSQNSAAVTFPAGRFSLPPLVVVSLNNAPGGTQKFVPRAINVTASGFTAFIYTGDSTSATGTGGVSWIAAQMFSATAEG